MNTIKKLFGFSTVKSEIMKLFGAKIALAEKDFKAGVEEIKIELKENLEAAALKAKADTEVLLQNLVKKVVSDLVN